MSSSENIHYGGISIWVLIVLRWILAFCVASKAPGSCRQAETERPFIPDILQMHKVQQIYIYIFGALPKRFCEMNFCFMLLRSHIKLKFMRMFGCARAMQFVFFELRKLRISVSTTTRHAAFSMHRSVGVLLRNGATDRIDTRCKINCMQINI